MHLHLVKWEAAGTQLRMFQITGISVLIKKLNNYTVHNNATSTFKFAIIQVCIHQHILKMITKHMESLCH